MSKQQTYLTDLFEVWRDVPGYEGDYLVSDQGRIWSFKTKRFLKPADNGHGYKMVVLSKNGKTKNFSVHKLVALVFVANEQPEITTEIDHIDFDRSNNKANNLRWVTPSENRKRRRNIVKIAAYDIVTGERVGVWSSQTEAAKAFGCSTGLINQAVNGGRKTAVGFTWRRLDD